MVLAKNDEAIAGVGEAKPEGIANLLQTQKG
jgi:hypothetical protein